MKSGVKTGMVGRCITAVFIFALFLGSHGAAYAQSAAELYNQATQSYKIKQFHEAAEGYEKLIAQGYKKPEVYYNLGNCYFKLDSLGKSLLNYERALKLSPKDEDVLYNLKLARSKVIDNIQPVPQLGIITWWNNFRSIYTSTSWGVSALVLVWIAILVFAVSLFTGRRRIFNIIAVSFLLLSFISLALGIRQQREEVRSNTAIIMVPSSYVKSAPDITASDLFMIHEGTRLEVLDQVGEWNKIRLEDGKVGWMEKDKFEKIW